MRRDWRWVGARSTGTSHIKSGLPCQDYVASMEIDAPMGSVFAAVVSDGASSASHGAVGARMICTGFLKAAYQYLRCGKRVEDIDRETVLEWLDRIRDRVNAFAERNQITPRDCAATLVGVLVGPKAAIVIHVGDGAVVVREQGTTHWIVPSWPYHGEYASTTTFVTDDPMPEPAVVPLPVRLDRVAVFSDGIERLVLDHVRRVAHAPFFESKTEVVANSAIRGHDRSLSKALREYLDSEAVCDRTDDDKSLILGVRQ